LISLWNRLRNCDFVIFAINSLEFNPNGKEFIEAEIQIRTVAMDFWASLEHKLKYKKDVQNAEEIVKKLKDCADFIEILDYQMQGIRDEIDRTQE